MSVVTASWSVPSDGAWSVLVHGGAGDVPVDARPLHAAGCKRAAEIAADVLRRGGSALDAVEHAVRTLEDDPRFNAGTGACLNEEGNVELDASIMDGATLGFGGVCALPPFTNPIAIARAVLNDGEHVLYAGEGAARFALAHGFARAEAQAMITEAARARWEAAGKARPNWAGGTVGAVARDAGGHVAAATSTGGRVRKRVGRVGDSPIPGAGTYADDRAGACSTTGDGEAMLRLCTAKGTVDAARGGASLEGAVCAALVDLARIGGSGGLLLVGPDGALAWARSTATMSWAAASAGWAEARAGA